MRYQSWGRYPSVRQSARLHYWQTDGLPETNKTLLPFGNGRSYGDVCLNSEGLLLDTQRLNHFLHFDRAKGVLRCEAGVRLDEILALIMPVGWFLPVTPGTQFITLGGAIANDVHGKNHHRAGTFGCHVRSFELLRSDGSRQVCSPAENTGLFAATVGGLGLTGLILQAEIQLIPICNPLIEEEVIKFYDIDEFFTLSRASEADYAYTVAWLDCLAAGKKLGRGLLMRGNHAAPRQDVSYTMNRLPRLGVPADMPGFVLNRYSIKGFNEIYFHKQRQKNCQGVVHYIPFFYPLDSLMNWNRIYGKRGFFQYQCILPHKDTVAARELLTAIAGSGLGSFLAVMKLFGDVPSPGLLSFPRQGFTLALDFANRGRITLDLFNKLDEIVSACDGAVYPAKDARMSAQHFKRFFPRWEEMHQHIDPRFCSDFWRRVMV
ncbi:MAG: FAD-binding oxidoreductase [Gammaproteobacteria bacterium]|nr:FAD-binding oxidoreductase [Gammaproteobacteria bacterium]